VTKARRKVAAEKEYPDCEKKKFRKAKVEALSKELKSTGGSSR